MRRVALATMLLGGCAGGVDTTRDPLVGEDAACAAEMTLGTGNVDFTPVAGGDTLYLYDGTPDGYMLWLSVRARGLDPRDVRVCYTERFADTGEAFGAGCWRVVLRTRLEGGWSELVGIWGQVDRAWWPTPYKIRGRDATVDVTMVDAAGCAAEARWGLIHIAADAPF